MSELVGCELVGSMSELLGSMRELMGSELVGSISELVGSTSELVGSISKLVRWCWKRICEASVQSIPISFPGFYLLQKTGVFSATGRCCLCCAANGS